MQLVILDRDGVINQESKEYVKSPEEWIPITGSLEAIARLNRAGYQVVVITNQSGVGRRKFSINALNEIHLKMFRAVQSLGGHIDAVLFCPHQPDDVCQCRKPKPGLFKELESRLNTNLKGIRAVGDSMRDLIAADRANATPVLVKTGNGRHTEQELKTNSKKWKQKPEVYDDLADFVDAFLSS